MPSEPELAIHATAVAIGGFAVLIRGASRSGKSTLAFDLIALSASARPILLIGDDRVLLRRSGAAMLVSPHPRIAGLIEKRGCGILARPYCTDVAVRGIVDLAAPRDAGVARSCGLGGQNFPVLTLVIEDTWSARAARVLAWFATLPAHPCAKTGRERLRFAKD